MLPACFQISIFYKILKYAIFYIFIRKNQNLYKYLETLETLETFWLFAIFYMAKREIEKGNKLETCFQNLETKSQHRIIGTSHGTE